MKCSGSSRNRVPRCQNILFDSRLDSRSIEERMDRQRTRHLTRLVGLAYLHALGWLKRGQCRHIYWSVWDTSEHTHPAGCGIARAVVQILIQKCKPSQYFFLFDDVFLGSRILSFLKPNLPKPKRQRKIRRRFCPGHLLRCGMRQRHGNKSADPTRDPVAGVVGLARVGYGVTVDKKTGNG